jgi:anti-sigma B factor antagonist
VQDEGLRSLDGDRPELWLSQTRVGHRLVVAAAGEIDIASADELREVLAGAVISGAAEIWLDLSNVSFMDSTGVRAIVDARGSLNGRRFALICPDGPVRRVIEIAGVDRAIAIHASRAEAHVA